MSTINLASREGQYVGVSKRHTRELFGREYRLILYGAMDAFGLIGSENNGIALLNYSDRDVIMDGDCQIGSGYCGPSGSQLKRFQYLTSLTDEEFVEEIENNPRFRGHWYR